MSRGPRWLLCATLLLWRPLDFAFEFPSTLPSLGVRGVAGVLELLFHGAVAACAVAAARALSNEMPSGPLLARIALVASAVASVQSFYWSVLPHQTMPGDRLPLALLAVVVAAAWLGYLLRYRDTSLLKRGPAKAGHYENVRECPPSGGPGEAGPGRPDNTREPARSCRSLRRIRADGGLPLPRSAGACGR